MSDYISREAARPDTFCEGVSCQDCPFCKDLVRGGCRIDDFVKAIPAADVVEVRHGHWILHISDLYPADSTMECSSCNEEQLIGTSDSYCPNCGAKMEGRTNEDSTDDHDGE